MFDLEEKIAEWRRQMAAGGIRSRQTLNELESHLREEIQTQLTSGGDTEQAFRLAVQHIGSTESLNMEFNKIASENWNRPLAFTAWALFVISFFLPAFENGYGWQCAGISASAWRGGTMLDTSVSVHLALLTPANLLMLASPFLLSRFSQNPRSSKWVRFALLAAWVLVWSFVLRPFVQGGWEDLKIGCYVWAASFALLNLATLKIRGPEMHSAAANS